MPDNTPPSISDLFGEKVKIDPQTAREIHIRSQMERLKDPEALKKLDVLSQEQKQNLEKAKIDFDERRNKMIKDWTTMLLIEEKTKPSMTLRPKYFDRAVRDNMESIARQQAEVRTLAHEQNEIHAMREGFIAQQENLLTEATSQSARQEFNQRAKKSITIDFNQKGGRSR